MTEEEVIKLLNLEPLPEEVGSKAILALTRLKAHRASVQ